MCNALLRGLFAGALLLGAPLAHAEGPPSVDAIIKLQGGSGRDAAILIGNEAYAALPQATYASGDARAMQQFLIGGMGLSKSRVTFSENLTAAQIVDGVKRASSKVKRNGTLWIYYAGHGTTVGDGRDRALLGIDASTGAFDRAAVSLNDVIAATSRAKAARIFFVVDAGFGGDGRDGLELLPSQRTQVGAFSGTDNNRVMLWVADQGQRTVAAYADSRHGLFTWLFMGAMRGWADGALTGGERDGRINVEEAQYFVTWSGRRMGWPMDPSEELRPTQRDWTFTLGNLEKGPKPEDFAELGVADRARRFAQAEERLKAEAAAFWQQTVSLAKDGGDSGKEALKAFIDEYSMPIVTVEWAVFIPEVLEAKRVLETYDRPVSANPTDGTSPPPTSGTPTGVEILSAMPTETCDDLVALEGLALLGQISDGQGLCLQNRLNTARLQTTRNKISRMLLVNAEAKGDIPQWEKLIRRHLEEIDRSDPNLCLRYAVFLHKKGLEGEEEAIYWADYALENKHIWVGDEYMKRVYSLYRLRTEAAAKLWEAAEDRYRKEPTDENEEVAKEYRGQAKDFAREWLDYARASAQDSKVAQEICRSAAGSDDFCKGK